MEKNITRRKALKAGGAALAVVGATAAVILVGDRPGDRMTSAIFGKLRALIADLEAYDGDLVMARLWERSEIVTQLRTVLGEPETRTIEEYWSSPELAEVREAQWQQRLSRLNANRIAMTARNKNCSLGGAA